MHRKGCVCETCFLLQTVVEAAADGVKSEEEVQYPETMYACGGPVEKMPRMTTAVSALSDEMLSRIAAMSEAGEMPQVQFVVNSGPAKEGGPLHDSLFGEDRMERLMKPSLQGFGAGIEASPRIGADQYKLQVKEGMSGKLYAGGIGVDCNMPSRVLVDREETLRQFSNAGVVLVHLYSGNPRSTRAGEKLLIALLDQVIEFAKESE